MAINIAELKVAINAKVVKLAGAEKVTKQLLGELSRELIEYVFVQKTNDIDAVNRTINACSPVNRKIAIMFFSNFLPFQWVEDEQRFGGMLKKQIEKKTELCITFLASDQTIWDWAQENVEMKAKDKDYLALVTKAVSEAVKKEKGASEILQAVLAGGLTIDNMMLMLEAAAKQVQEEVKEAA